MSDPAPDPIDGYLRDLAHRLRRSPALRERMLEEAREHLEEAAAERRRQGLDEHAAALESVAQFGSPRSLARALVPRRRRRIIRAAALSVGACLVGGLAFAQVTGPTNLVGIMSAQKIVRGRSGPILSGLGVARLVSLDPTTLAPVGAGIPLRTGHVVYLGDLPPEVGLRAPNGQQLGVVSNGAVEVYGLRPLRRTATLRFAPASPLRGPRSVAQRGGSQTAVRAGAWLADGRIALLVQHQAPPYASRITSRTLVVLDTVTDRVVRRHVDLRGTIMGFASAGSRLVVLACHDGRSTLFAAGGSTMQTWTVSVALPCGHQTPATVAISPGGTQAAIIGGDLIPVRIDLLGHSVNRLRPLTSSSVARVSRGNLGLSWVGASLVVTGARYVGPGNRRVRGLGVTLVDAMSGAQRVVSRNGSSVLAVGDILVAGGFASQTHGRAAGIGLTAFASTGAKLWHADSTRLVWPFETGQRVYAPRSVKRHTTVDVFDLRTGRPFGSLFQRGQGVRPLTGVVDPVGT